MRTNRQWTADSWRQALSTAHCLLPLFVFLCLGALVVDAAEREGRWAILVAGVSGDTDLQERYLKEIKDLRSALEGALEFPRSQVFVLFDDPSKDSSLIQYRSTRESLERVSHDLATRVGKDDLLFVFIEGHGDYDGKVYKLNLVGRDPAAEEMAAMLYSIPARRFVVVNATNCSGGSLSALSQKGKIVITATKSGFEKNLTHMGWFFVEAFKDNNADTDKNGRVSMLEAFSYASKKVEERYANEGNLQTEHSVLDDNGDAQGQSKPGPDNGEGLLAQTTFLDAGLSLAAQGSLTPEEWGLARQAQALEMQIEALKYAKAEMPVDDYEKKLEELLLRLAQINAKLRNK